MKTRAVLFFVTLAALASGCASVPVRSGSVGYKNQAPVITTNFSGTATAKLQPIQKDGTVQMVPMEVNVTTNFVVTSTPPVEERTWRERVLGQRPPAPTQFIPSTGVAVVEPPQPVVVSPDYYGYGRRSYGYGGYGYGTFPGFSFGGFRGSSGAGFGGGFGGGQLPGFNLGSGRARSGTSVPPPRTTQPTFRFRSAAVETESFQSGRGALATSFNRAQAVGVASGTTRLGGSVGKLQSRLQAAKYKFGGLGLSDTGGVPVDLIRTHTLGTQVRAAAVSDSGLVRARRSRSGF